jgi:hypothetical protein
VSKTVRGPGFPAAVAPLARAGAAALLAFAFASAAVAQPTLTVNGVTSGDNTAIAHAKKGGPFVIELTGTPGAPFALLLGADAFDGVPGGEPVVTSGFFLRPWVIGQAIDVPIHPVFDGIGMEFIRQKLNSSGQATLAPDDIVNDVPSPFFRFDASGKFTLNATTPNFAFLLNVATMPIANPLPIELESIGSTIGLYLQVVELDVQTLDVDTGNGMTVIFDSILYSGHLSYAEGVDVNAASSIVTNRLTVSTISDGNFADANTTAPVVEPAFAGFNGTLDFWLIMAGGGVNPLYSGSNYPNSINGLPGNPVDPDNAGTISGTFHNHATGIEAFSGVRPSRNNENREFPFIALPGNKRVYHWFDATTQRFGFAIYFEETGVWRNLTPGAFAVSHNTDGTSGTVSPWEVEVAFTPDGTRMAAVLDQAATTTPRDRLFIFNLEPGGTFSNGQPVFEVLPTLGDELNYGRIFEESMTFLKGNDGKWYIYYPTFNSTAFTVAQYPTRLYRADASNSISTPSTIIPGFATALIGIARIDRMLFPTADHTGMAFIAGYGTTPQNNESVLFLGNVSAFGQSVTNCTATMNPLGESNDATDGNLGTFTLSPDGSRFAFTREDGTTRYPRMATTNGSLAGQTFDLLADLNDGGLVDKVDFPAGRDFHFSKDSAFLVLQQGLFLSGFLPERFEIFVIDLLTGATRNLTRTSKTLGQPSTLLGPWNPNGSTEGGTLEPTGSFKSLNGDFVYYFRELRQAPTDFARFNLIGISIAALPGASEPNFHIVNVTGTEFAPYDGLAPPPFGAPNMAGPGGAPLPFNADWSVESFKVRRMGGTGPYKDYMLITGPIATTGGAPIPTTDVDQLWTFDPENPAPAILLTSFSTAAGSTIPVSTGARITSVRPDADNGRILFVLDSDGAAAAFKQDLVMLDLNDFNTPKRIPENAVPFSRVIGAGSFAFFPGQPSGIAFVAGTRQRPFGTTDGVGVGEDFGNPTDASPFFHRPVSPATTFQVQPLTTAARAAMIFGVRTN